jgi:hypothetical protein
LNFQERDRKEEELKIQTYQSMEIKKKFQEPTVPALETAVKEGWMKKKGERRTNWTTRWFVLKYKTLTYFKNPRVTYTHTLSHNSTVSLSFETQE